MSLHMPQNSPLLGEPVSTEHAEFIALQDCFTSSNRHNTCVEKIGEPGDEDRYNLLSSALFLDSYKLFPTCPSFSMPGLRTRLAIFLLDLLELV